MTQPQDVGTFRAYEPWNPRPETLATLDRANAILQRSEARGIILTLRGLHYRMIGGDYENTSTDYNRLKSIISRGRIAGMVSWTGLEDMGRYLRGLSTDSSPAAAIRHAAAAYRRDLWEDQPYRLELWIEKDAGISTVASICDQLRVNYFACRGYSSSTEQWKAGQRFADYVRRGQRPVVLHVGDLDPSGWDMTRDIRKRVSQFAGTPVLVQRLALNIDMVRELGLPPNPDVDIMGRDSRAQEYQRLFGDDTWELDALDPDWLMGLIDRSVRQFRDEAIWDRSLAREVSERQLMETFAEEMGGLG